MINTVDGFQTNAIELMNNINKIIKIRSTLNFKKVLFSNRVYILFVGCTDTSDLRHFEPKTFRHYVFGAEVSKIFALVCAEVWHRCRSV